MINYNPKIDYLISKYSYHNYKKSNDEKICRMVYQGNLISQTESERFMLLMKNALIYIKGYSGDFNESFIRNVFNILEGQDFEYKKGLVTELVNEFSKWSSLVATRVLYYILSKTPFGDINMEMGVLLFDYIRLSRNQIPLIFYPSIREEILKFINEGIDINTFNFQISVYCRKAFSANKKHQLFTRDDIVNKLLTKENEFKALKVESISLYGSFARNEATIYSDVDLFIKGSFNTDLSSDEFKAIKSLLSKTLNISYDFTLNQFDETYSVEPLKDLYLVF